MVVENIDGELKFLVGIVNSSSAEIPITLSVNGAIVTGLLIDADKWALGYANYLKQISAVGFAPLIELLEMRSTVTSSEETEPSNLAPEEPLPPNYIHLREAKYLSGTAIIPTDDGFYWRGKLSEVSGWSIGSLGTN